MIRSSSLIQLMVLLVLGLMVGGCGKKEETTSAPPEKPAAVKGVNMQEGKWEITSTFEMEGMPAGMMQPQTFTTCLKQNDYVPRDEEQKDCSMKNVTIDGDTVSWEVVCKDSSGRGRVTYAGSTFDGIMETFMKEGGKESTAKMTMKGKRTGPCDK